MLSSLQERLQTVMVSGSKAEKVLASYMNEAFAELPFETAASIAAKARLSEATVGRFCRSIGFKSFKDLKEHLRGNEIEHPWLLGKRLEDLHTSSNEDRSDLAAGMEMEIAAVIKIYEMCGSVAWERAVERLSTCKRVMVVGFQTERGQAQYFANQLQYLRDGVSLLDLTGGNFAEALLTDEECCVVMFEARRYSRLAKGLAAQANDADIAVTLVTDSFCDWGQELADEVFAIPTLFNQFWDSTAQMSCFSNLLINSVFRALGPNVEDRFDKITRLYGGFTGHVGAADTQIFK
ncbi:MurR/RpiR family transcriptional regulator [Pseudovibrio sp. Tun.PSC04-5.I4]|uniref:MurR/RpiR family transcriptional regulator n=1 Tax=Pseudovibrio sp. Tun.PSC04-5.I4 TaxID=1798213 RepID=UPI000B82E3A5|nr:MurR/RpiR family transcriptional regulator [Pseudovibrio sp. Tun.PSC04-5.I4]